MIVFLVLLLALLMVVSQVTPAMLIELWREREGYAQEDYPHGQEIGGGQLFLLAGAEEALFLLLRRGIPTAIPR